MTWSLRSSASAVASYFGISRTGQDFVPPRSGESTLQSAKDARFQFLTPERVEHPWPKYRCGRCGVIFKRGPQQNWFSLEDIYNAHKSVCKDAFVYRMGVHYGGEKFILGSTPAEVALLTKISHRQGLGKKSNG